MEANDFLAPAFRQCGSTGTPKCERPLCASHRSQGPIAETDIVVMDCRRRLHQRPNPRLARAYWSGTPTRGSSARTEVRTWAGSTFLPPKGNEAAGDTTGFDGSAAEVSTVLKQDRYCGHMFLFRGKQAAILKSYTTMTPAYACSPSGSSKGSSFGPQYRHHLEANAGAAGVPDGWGRLVISVRCAMLCATIAQESSASLLFSFPRQSRRQPSRR